MEKVMMMMMMIWFAAFILWSSPASGLDGTRISGPNGYCVQVKGGNYIRRNPVILSPCESTVSFIWTFSSTDGTLRSNGMCLATSGIVEGSSTFIENCSGQDVDNQTITWELQNNGHTNIVNRQSGLLLTGIYGQDGTVLTVNTNASSTFQQWRFNNVSEPNVEYITTFRGACLQTWYPSDNNAVVAYGCHPDVFEIEWRFYPDGTLRPAKHLNLCLSYDNLISKKVFVVACGLDPTSQLWIYLPNDMILNPKSNLVLEHNPQQAVVSSPNEANEYQKWTFRPVTFIDQMIE